MDCDQFEDYNGEFIDENQDCFKYMSSEQLEMFRQKHFDPQDFMEDEQLLVLIEKYDPEMSQSDIEYLIQLEDREAVINTLYAKLIEKEHILMINNQNNITDTNEFQEEDDQFNIDQTSYNASLMNQDISKLKNRLSSAHFDSKYSNQNQHFPEYQNHNSTSEAKNTKNQKKKLKKKQKLSQNEDQKISASNNFTNEKQQMSQICNQKNLNVCSSHIKNNDLPSMNSFEEEIYDEEFEQELQNFRKKILPKKDCSLERIYCQLQKNEQTQKCFKKLVPNVSTEWINYLKSLIKTKKVEKSESRTNQNSNSIQEIQNDSKIGQGQQIDDHNLECQNFKVIQKNEIINTQQYVNIRQNNQNQDKNQDQKKQRLTAPNRNAWQDQNNIKQKAQENDEKNRKKKVMNNNMRVQNEIQNLNEKTAKNAAGINFNSPRATERISGYDFC